MADEDIDDQADGEPGPDKEPENARAWLAMITEAERAFKDYQDRADNIDKQYANLDRLASSTRDRQFQLFWANIQVLGPSIYSRPPVPVVVPKFKDRQPLLRVTSELLERSTVVAFGLEDIDGVMRMVRDDLVVLARGCAWVRYEAKAKGSDLTERLCIDHVDRKDFLTAAARSWKEVDWVSKASYLTKKAMRKRFRKSSGDEYKKAAYEQRKDDETDDNVLKAKVWEVWSKSLNKVVWVSEGCEKLLDSDEPHLKLEGFFPCPRPAYATVQRRSLIPVPDMVFYKDQLEEINELTTRIGALTDAVKLRGFYPAGAGEIGDAIETAYKKTEDNVVLIGVSNWAMLGGGSAKDMIVWLPLEMIAKTITELVNLRKQLIDDVYQITGLSDIMRGSTVASETLGAQELKSQYGSIRIRDRQAELIRLARDLTRIGAEIMAENFTSKTLLSMSQMEIPTDADMAKQIKPLQRRLDKLEKDAREAMEDPETQQMAQQNPEKAQEVFQKVQGEIQGLQGQIAEMKDTPTVEKIMKLLRDEKLRPFALDIETDSTIAPDENATKQRATEYVTAIGGFMGQALPLVQALPQSAPVVADVLKFAASQFRAGRQVEGAIEEFADQMKQLAGQPKGPDPEQAKQAAEVQAAQAQQQMDAQRTQAEAAEKEANAQKIAAEAQSKFADDEQARRLKDADAAAEAERSQIEFDRKMAAAQYDEECKAAKHAQETEIRQLQIDKLRLEIDGVVAKTDAALATTAAKIEQTETQTENSVIATDASVEATARKADAFEKEDA